MIDLQLKPKDSMQGSDCLCESPTLPPVLHTQRNQDLERRTRAALGGRSNTSTVDPPGRRSDSCPRGPEAMTGSSGRRLKTAASTPSLRSPNDSSAFSQERNPGPHTVDALSRVRVPESPSPWAPSEPLCWTPFDHSSKHIVPSRDRFPPSGEDRPVYMQSNFAYRDVSSDHVLYDRVPRIDFASTDAAARTQDIVEILDAVLWLARTHNGSGLKDIASYTAAFRTSSRQGYPYT